MVPAEPLEPLAGSSTDAPAEPLEPLASSSTDAPAEPLEPLAGSSTDAPNALAMVDKVVSLLEKAKARNKLAQATEFLRQRIGHHLPSMGGEMLTEDAFEEAQKRMSTNAD